jgi:hypothetical protein
MKTAIISSVQQFHSKILETYDFHPLFRGEPKSTYTLRCKFGRHSSVNKINDIDSEKETLAEFKRRSFPHLKHEPIDEWEWLALAQHHGLATRLLDWTKNPLVAAYFATIDPISNEDAVIYVIDEYDLEEPEENSSPFSIERNHIYRPRLSTRRIETQSGLFTVHHKPEEPFRTKSLQRWVIDKNMIIEMNTMLHTYGITKSMIFPGLDSICSEIHDSYIRDEIEFE